MKLRFTKEVSKDELVGLNRRQISGWKAGSLVGKNEKEQFLMDLKKLYDAFLTGNAKLAAIEARGLPAMPQAAAA